MSDYSFTYNVGLVVVAEMLRQDQRYLDIRYCLLAARMTSIVARSDVLASAISLNCAKTRILLCLNNALSGVA